MAEIRVPGSSNLHFGALSGANTIIFGSEIAPGISDIGGINTLILNASGGTTISFNGGVNFMPVTDGTHQFLNLSVKRILFGAGTYSGIGIRL